MRTTYHGMLDVLRTARSIERGKPIDRNTRLMMRGTSVAVRLHETDIVTYAEDGSVTLNTGGWKTVTTKDRINNFSPFAVWSRRGTWFVHGIGSEPVPFADGMTITAAGEVRGAGPADTEQVERDTRKAVKEYAAAFVSKLYDGLLGAPSEGDCMACRMGATLGSGDESHVKLHMIERYYVPQLLVNALREFGASQAATGNAWAYMNWDQSINTLGDALSYERGKPHGAYSTKRDDFIAKQIEKCVRRYVLRQLGIST